MSASTARNPARSGIGRYRGSSAQERRAARREALIRAAVLVYGERGYRNATVKAVCEAAGLTERYFYESFANSEALLAASYQAVTGVLLKRLEEVGAETRGAPAGRVRAILACYFEALAGDPRSARLFLVEIAGVSVGLDRVFAASLEAFGDLLERTSATTPGTRWSARRWSAASSTSRPTGCAILCRAGRGGDRRGLAPLSHPRKRPVALLLTRVEARGIVTACEGTPANGSREREFACRRCRLAADLDHENEGVSAMKTSLLFALGCTVSALALTTPAFAQTVPAPDDEEQTADQAGDAASGATDSAETGSTEADILVTAQRRTESLQSVPIAVSAFSGEALERQQIENASDLQQSLPNVTYTKTNFTSSSFTIRGIGDLCTGFSCDSATGIHVNDMPLTSTRLFETEYFDLERIEVLRGPQGTLFGRNATSGVVNFITARPDLNDIHASASAEYGNFDSKKLTGMINVPIATSSASASPATG